MTIALVKTKAEQAFAEAFARVIDELPGGPDVRAIREDAIGRFVGLGLPHRRIEAWKYTDLRALLKEALPPARPPIRSKRKDIESALPLADIDAIRLAFVDGFFAERLSRFDGDRGQSYHFDPLARGLELGFGWLTDHLAGTEGPKGEAILALNTAFATDGALLRVEAGAHLARPIHLIFLSSGAGAARATTRSFIEIGKGAEATIIESHIASAAAPRQTNAVTEIAVHDGARVTHIKDTREGAAALHLGTWLVELGAEADYRAFQFTAGPSLVRNQLFVTFGGEDATLDLSGAFLGRGTEHIDTTLVVDHAVPGCASRELFKGVLDDRARGVFQGKIIVRPDAQKTDGKQMAQALMLSPDAEFDSKPELEIYADDVVCGHGSTAAELDEDLVFYCRSRGIPPDEARALLTEAFIGEAIEKIEHEGLRGALMSEARRWLAGTPNEEPTP